MTLRIEPYKPASKGAKALSLRTGILRATRKQVAKHGDFDTLLNWGNSERRFHGQYINDPEAVAVASDKLRSCRRFGEASIPSPKWTTDRRVAKQWYELGQTVLARTRLRSSGGRGITILDPSNESEFNLPNDREGGRDGGGVECSGQPSERAGGEASVQSSRASNNGGGGGGAGNAHAGPERYVIEAPLYTLYVKKAHEYRIHVFDGKVIDVQMKRKRRETDDEVNYQIRNSENGWVYCRDDIIPPDPTILRAAIRAVNILGLDFGAADIGWNMHSGEPSVYEVNTAPGLEGTTLDKYYEALLARLPQLQGGAFKRRRG